MNACWMWLKEIRLILTIDNACGMCHVVIDKWLYNALPRAMDVEEDLLESVRG